MKLQRTLVGLVAISTVSWAAETKQLAQADVPKAVMEVVKTKYPGAKITGVYKDTEEGRTVYELRLNEGKTEMDVDVDEAGKVISEEKRAVAEDLPSPAKEAFQKKYPKWKIEKIEQVTMAGHEDTSRYEITAKQGANRKEVVLTSDGKMLSTEAAHKTGTRGVAKREMEHDQGSVK